MLEGGACLPRASSIRSQKEPSCGNSFMYRDQAEHKNREVSSLLTPIQACRSTNPRRIRSVCAAFQYGNQKEANQHLQAVQKLSLLPLPVVWETRKSICAPSMPDLWRTGRSREVRTNGTRSEEEHGAGMPQPPPAHTEGRRQSPPDKHLLLRTRIKTPG